MQTENDIIEIVVTKEDAQNFKRLDAFLADKLPDFSRTLIKKFFQEGNFQTSSGIKLELKKMPQASTTILFSAPQIKDVDLEPQNIPLEILFEDEYLAIINKPAGLVVHPAPGNPDNTLVNAILYHCPDLKGVGNEKRPGIVHRLDKGTSGIMVVAKEQKTHEGLVSLFSTHDIQRKYEAISLGAKIPPSQKLESLIGRSVHNRLKMSTKVSRGKSAITYMSVLNYFDRFSHVELKLETGRTHQIRVHLSELLNAPIINDPLYGRSKEEAHFFSTQLKSLLSQYEHPLLHAKVLGFIHPITKQELFFEQAPPPIFQETLKILKEHHG